MRSRIAVVCAGAIASAYQLELSGLLSKTATVEPLRFTSGNFVSSWSDDSPSSIEFTGLARNVGVTPPNPVGKFARIDMHGHFGSPCEFWGMVIPSG